MNGWFELSQNKEGGKDDSKQNMGEGPLQQAKRKCLDRGGNVVQSHAIKNTELRTTCAGHAGSSSWRF